MEHYELIWLLEQKNIPNFITSSYIIPFLYSKPLICESCNKAIYYKNKSVVWFFDGNTKCANCIPPARPPPTRFNR